MYQRYIDDIFAIVQGGVGKGPEAGKRIEKGLNELNFAIVEGGVGKGLEAEKKNRERIEYVG